MPDFFLEHKNNELLAEYGIQMKLKMKGLACAEHVCWFCFVSFYCIWVVWLRMVVVS